MILCRARLWERGLCDMGAPARAQTRLFAIPGGWKSYPVEVGGLSLHLTIPADPDRLLDAAADGGDSDGEPSDPYWAALWSAATPTAAAVWRATWPPGTTVLELGCGVGLVGLAALARGYDVTFSDAVPQAVHVALENARQNGYPQARSRVIDWHAPPDGAYDVLLASDVLYHRGSHAALLRAIGRLMGPTGVCWIGDPGRYVAREFIHAAADRFLVELRDGDGRPFGVPHVGQFQMLVLRHRSP